MQYDLLIKNVTIADGTGGPLRTGDAAVAGGKVAAVEKKGVLFEADAAQVVYGRGRVLSPGFIDAHVHCEKLILTDPAAAHKTAQGITTLITGHCGDSIYPGARFEDLEAWRQACRNLSVNLVSLTGHGTLREQVLGEGSRACSAEGLAQMTALLERQLQQGAAGFSSGLEYAPGCYADADELTALARVCARCGGVYSTHMRSEGSRLLEAAAETIQIAAQSGCRTVISHLKACGRPNHGLVSTVLSMVDAANAGGCKIYADAYPYPAASTGLSIVLPQWTLENGQAAMLHRLRDPAFRAEIHRWFTLGTDIWENRSIVTGWENITVASARNPALQPFVGRTIREIAALRGRTEVDTVLDLLLEEGDDLPAILRSACEEDLRAAYAHPRVMVCSDSMDVTGGHPHPRLYGSHARYLCRYAGIHDEKSLSAAVYRMTGLPAMVYGLPDTGRIAVGLRADLALWAPEDIRDTATFEDPCRLAEGMAAVWTGGRLCWQEDHPAAGCGGVFLRTRQRPAPGGTQA